MTESIPEADLTQSEEFQGLFKGFNADENIQTMRWRSKEPLAKVSVCKWCSPETWPHLNPGEKYGYGVCPPCMRRMAKPYKQTNPKIYKAIMDTSEAIEIKSGIIPPKPDRGSRRIASRILDFARTGVTALRTRIPLIKQAPSFPHYIF